MIHEVEHELFQNHAQSTRADFARHGFAGDGLQSAAADEQDVGGIDRGEFLVGMLASALGRNVGHRAFQNLQQRLLHALAADVAGDGGIFVFAADLVDFIDVDDAGLRAAHVAVGGLQQLEYDVLDVFADIAGFGQGGGVDDGEGNVEHARQGLGQQGLAGDGGADEQDVRLGEFDLAALGAVHMNAFVVVIDGHGKLFLGLVLADYVFVEKRLHFLGLGQVVGRGGGVSFRPVVFKDGIADRNALVTDVRPGGVTR